MNRSLIIIFDNAPSAHKEGLIEKFALESEIIIFHLASKRDQEHPSKKYLRKISFVNSRYIIDPKLNFFEINKKFEQIFHGINIRKNYYSSIKIIYSFLDFRRLLLVLLLKRKVINLTNQLKLIPHFEPIRLNDYFLFPRLVKISFSLIFQKIFLKSNEIYLFSSLNKFFYKLFFEKVSIYPYQQTKSYILQCKNNLVNKKNKIFKVIYIGQLIKRKNPILLIDACQKLRFKTELTILGEGSLRANIFRYYKKLKNYSSLRINFIDNLENNKVISLLKKSDVLVLPSKFDGFGFVVAEAIYTNTFVITSSQVGSKDLIVEGINGSIFKNNSFDELYNHLNLHYLRINNL